MVSPLHRCGSLARAVATAAGVAAALTAQTDRPRQPPAGGKAAPQAKSVVLLTYDEAESRAAFATIDANADDRLSVFEFTRGQDEAEAADLRDVTAFRRTDSDRDGFVDWPEFDARVRGAIRLKGEFRYRPVRTIPPPPPATEAAAADKATDERVRALLGMLDADRSGTLSREELSMLIASAGLPAASLSAFAVADRDGDRQLSAVEFATLTRLLNSLPGGPQGQASAKGFSMPWRRADLDGNGEIAANEMEMALRGIDVHLGRWVDKVIVDADRTQDGKLGPAEVAKAEGPPGEPPDQKR